ncbi:putative chaperone [Periconia macrospinosa]|uniref:Putative chaperone n=1 Tax=Periconia macrospinosa TaxID=97972 RepID=A0A2V1DN80_9PLEO|nr:putative chaperone [Periconia macrospinosa]
MQFIRSSTTTLRAHLSSETSASLRLQRHRPQPCLFCANRIPSSIYQQREQSTSQSKNQTHYTFFPTTLPSGPPPQGAFTVDVNALKREFLQLQARAHPDLHPPEDKNKAQALSARINEAYKTLQNPLLRAQYLLSLRGIEVAEDETAKVEDPELLMEVLETREEIEEAQSEEDLVDMKTKNEDRIEKSVKILEEAFEKDDLDAAKSEAVKLRYWINIKESLDGWEQGKPVVLQH